MARTKRMSSVLESAQTRLAALSSIDPKLSLGTGLGVSDYNAQITCTRTGPRYLQHPALAGGRGL